jgi:hypothetical protein
VANYIYVIKPYKWEGMWVFDDKSTELIKEAFVGGADTIIDLAVARKGIKNADSGFLLLFSSGPFPSADVQLTWLREETGGNVYEWECQQGWLCPALLKYFAVAPAKIYAEFQQI